MGKHNKVFEGEIDLLRKAASQKREIILEYFCQTSTGALDFFTLALDDGVMWISVGDVAKMMGRKSLRKGDLADSRKSFKCLDGHRRVFVDLRKAITHMRESSAAISFSDMDVLAGLFGVLLGNEDVKDNTVRWSAAAPPQGKGSVFVEAVAAPPQEGGRVFVDRDSGAQSVSTLDPEIALAEDPPAVEKLCCEGNEPIQAPSDDELSSIPLAAEPQPPVEMEKDTDALPQMKRRKITTLHELLAQIDKER